MALRLNLRRKPRNKGRIVRNGLLRAQIESACQLLRGRQGIGDGLKLFDDVEHFSSPRPCAANVPLVCGARRTRRAADEAVAVATLQGDALPLDAAPPGFDFRGVRDS